MYRNALFTLYLKEKNLTVTIQEKTYFFFL